MRQPQLKAILFLIGILGVGYAIAIPITTGFLQAPLGLTSFANITAFAILFAVIMTVWLDKPLELELFKWSEKKPKAEKPQVIAPPPATEQEVAATPATARVEQATPVQLPAAPSEGLFPHEAPAEHWEADFGDSKQVYEGSDLPIWILAGWAMFILWTVVYLLFGLPTAF
jgi:hypothetical protein